MGYRCGKLTERVESFGQGDLLFAPPLPGNITYYQHDTAKFSLSVPQSAPA